MWWYFPHTIGGRVELTSELYLVTLFRESLAIEVINWRTMRMNFARKTGKSSEPKSYRPVNFTWFLLKAMEEILDNYTSEKVLFLHTHYTKDNMTISRANELCGFIDIEEAFDNTLYDSIEKAATEKSNNDLVVNWIVAVLNIRIITAE